MQMFAIVVSFALTVAAVAMLVPAVRRILPSASRDDTSIADEFRRLTESEFFHN